MSDNITLFLCGDVMTGRGIDQVLRHSGNPAIHEPYLKDAREYVRLAELASGPIPRPIDFNYIWGDAINEWRQVKPDLKIINLETAITKSEDYWRGKEVHYRMNPENTPCLTMAGIDFCSLANNHSLDWGYAGLADTLETLKKADIRTAGAGPNLREAESPAVMEIQRKGRVIVFSIGSMTSGVPYSWSAREDSPGLFIIKDYSSKTVEYIAKKVFAVKQPRDIVVVSIHWGNNWGYTISSEERDFTHNLIDKAGVNIIHGHSSHHIKGIEVYKDCLILYGCGDFLNDYEGIGGYEAFRGDLCLMYFADIDPVNGKLVRLRMTPMQIKKFRLSYTAQSDALWLRDVLNREGNKLGTSVELDKGTPTLSWKHPSF